MGLVIDGAVVAGEAGTYPVTNPARPAEVVLDAPSASAARSTGRGGRPPGGAAWAAWPGGRAAW